MSYATLAEFKAYLKIPTATTTEDTLLQSFLDEADKVIDDLVQRPSAATTATAHTFDMPDGALLMFDRAEVCVGITGVTNGDGTTVAPASYVTEPRNTLPFYGIRLKSNSGIDWEEGSAGPEGAISVTAKWAYTTNADGSADDLVVGAALQLAAWLYRSKDQVTELSRPVQTADGITVMPLALPNSVLDRLKARRGLI